MSTEIDTIGLHLTELLRDDMVRILSLSEHQADTNDAITMLAKHSLRMADAFLLANQQVQLALEPLTAVSVLEDVAHDISSLAKASGINVQVDVRGTCRPILAHRQSMRDMLTLIATAVLQRQDSSDNNQLVLGTHRNVGGTIVGAFGSNHHDMKLKQLTSLQHTNSPEVLLAVASRLGERLQAQVKTYKHASLYGFGATFSQSRQLQLFT